jgi:hypothetical protein
MIRNFITTAVALVVVAGLSAGEYKGKLKAADAEKGTITILVGKKKDAVEKTFTVDKGAKFTQVTPPKEKGGEATKETLTDGLKNELFSKTGKGSPTLTLVTDGEGDKEVVKEISATIGGKKKKNK